MDKQKITEWVNDIIQDITQDDVALENILRKTVVLAYQIKNDNLKTWVKNEIDGYEDNNMIPEYRILRAEVRGNLMQPGFGSILNRPDTKLPIEVLPNEQAMHFARSVFYQSISEIESLLKGDPNDTISINLTYPEVEIIQKKIRNFQIDTAWKVIPKNQVFGLIGKIKNRLLTFLLELNDEIGNYDDLTIMKKENIVNKLFAKNMKAKNITITVGNNNTITSSGKTVNNNIDDSLHKDLSEIIKTFKDIKNNIDDEQYENEVAKIEVEIAKEQPARSVLLKSLNTIKTMIVNVASNASTKPVVDTIGDIIKRLGE